MNDDQTFCLEKVKKFEGPPTLSGRVNSEDPVLYSVAKFCTLIVFKILNYKSSLMKGNLQFQK